MRSTERQFQLVVHSHVTSCARSGCSPGQEGENKQPALHYHDIAYAAHGCKLMDASWTLEEEWTPQSFCRLSSCCAVQPAALYEKQIHADCGYSVCNDSTGGIVSWAAGLLAQLPPLSSSLASPLVSPLTVTLASLLACAERDDSTSTRTQTTFVLSQTDRDTVLSFLPEVPRKRERLEALLGRCWVKNANAHFAIACAVCWNDTDGTNDTGNTGAGTIVLQGDPFLVLPCGHIACRQCSIHAVADHELELAEQPPRFVASRIEALMASLTCVACESTRA
jgi:hypothetical protein